MHGYWRDSEALRQKMALFQPAQVRFVTPFQDLFQGRVSSCEVLKDRRIILVQLPWLTRRMFSLPAPLPNDEHSGRAERWEPVSVEDGFSLEISFSYYYYQPSRSNDHPKGSRPERIKVSSPDGHKYWFIIMDDPLAIVEKNGNPIPNFLVRA
jgi:hypothetical protein